MISFAINVIQTEVGEVATFVQTRIKKPHHKTEGKTMAKDVIPVNGEERVVREDTAKAYRGVNWAWASIAAFIIIMVLLLVTFLMRSAVNTPAPPPAGAAQQ